MMSDTSKGVAKPNDGNVESAFLNLDIHQNKEEISASFLDEINRITNAVEPEQQRGPSESP